MHRCVKIEKQLVVFVWLVIEKHFTNDGKVRFAIMGEYEFSRTERAEREKGIAKMKSLGIPLRFHTEIRRRAMPFFL